MVNEIPLGYVGGSINQGITLAGSSQATGTVLSATHNVINSGSVCVLPSGLQAGETVKVVNLGAAIITPYPPVGFKISNQSTNTAGGTIVALAGALAGVGNFLSLGGNNYANA